MRYAFEQCNILYGDRASLIAKPRFISITDSFSPMSYDDTMLEMMIYCAENGIPQRIGGLGVAGLTTPVTLAGNLSQMTAEALAGIVLTQLIRPGVPVVLNNSSSCADMKSLGLTLGAPECALVCVGTAQLARFYGFPCRSGGADSDAKVADAQAGAESMMNLLTSQDFSIEAPFSNGKKMDQMILRCVQIGNGEKELKIMSNRNCPKTCTMHSGHMWNQYKTI